LATLLASVDAMGGVSSRLIYSRPEGANSCPDEKSVRAAVAERLGYDPFVAYASTTVVAEVFRRGAKFGARAYLVDESGQTRGSRELEADASDCGQLVAALTLAISIALDPMTVVGLPPSPVEPRELREPSPADRRDPVPPAVVARATVAPADNAKRLAPREADAEPWRGQALAGALVASGWVPAAAPGIYAGARVLVPPAWSLGIEGQAGLPSAQPSPSGSGRVVAWAWSAALVPCRRFSFLSACAVASAGEIIAHGEGVSLTRTQTAAYGALGGRVGAEWGWADRWALEFHGDLVAPITRVHFVVDGGDIWQAPTVMGAVGGGLAVRFW
jgi:hypothetical protein